MADIVLPEKDAFYGRVKEISTRIDGVSQGNKMAQLLHTNFKNWLSSSALSPIKLTEELDKDRNGMISGDEFATLLGSMTGERPPQWVVDLVFSFVDAKPEQGIPIDDWMAFLAASGMEIPNDLFTVPIVITGALDISPSEVVAGDAVSVTVSFNEPVDAYEINVLNTASGEQQNFVTQSADMDSPVLDEFVFEADDEGGYIVSIIHLGVRLDQAEFTVVAPPPADPVEQVPEEVTPPHVEEAPAEPAKASGFSALVQTLEACKLRSDAHLVIADASAYRVEGTVTEVSRTLMGTGQYRNGMTLSCKNHDGLVYQVMMRETELQAFVGQTLVADIAPVEWDVALRQVVCQEA